MSLHSNSDSRAGEEACCIKGYDLGAPEETGLGNYASSQLTETHFQWVHASFLKKSKVQASIRQEINVTYAGDKGY